jgi:hypothetical protein
MAGIEDIPVDAIPSATNAISGVVTTTTQTFAGDKTFSDNVIISKTLKVGNGTNATSTTTG